MHDEFPRYFLKPFYAIRKESDSVIEPDSVKMLVMEDLGETYPVETAESFGKEEFYNLVELVGDLHRNQYTSPHGDLRSNVWMTDEQELAISDPRGIPDGAAVARRWRELDRVALIEIAEEQALGEFTQDDIENIM